LEGKPAYVNVNRLRQRQPKTRTTTSHLALLPGYLAWERGQVKRHGNP